MNFVIPVANDNNIKKITASDIEKYHRGQLPPKEMNALEKAALDDPFLAEALEGFAVAGININADIAELRKRLSEKTEQAKVISIGAGGNSSFPWLRAAVMVVLIAGAGVLAYQFLFKGGKDDGIANVPAVEKKNTSESPETTVPQSDSNNTSFKDVTINKDSDNKSTTENEIKDQKDLAAKRNINNKIANDSVKSNFGLAVTDASTAAKTAPSKVPEEKTDSYKLDSLSKQKTEDAERKEVVAKNLSKDNEAVLKKPTANNTQGAVVPQNQNNAVGEVVTNGYAGKRSDFYRNTNIFRGRVTDASNNALPFANITNTNDNVGTYSDSQGNFTLVSPDSVLNVQVRSLGFTSNTIQLRNSLPTNRVMMQEDRSLPVDTIDKVKRNIKRNRNNTMTLEEPEPEDGWDSYGSYVVNNLNIPDKFEMKKTGETADNTVEVSFEVNKNGEPINIKVEKSLCDKCDKEAIRLIREGPKWKRKAKKSKRTTITVPFIKSD